MKNDKIVLAAGGTGGHVFPAFALADELIARGKDVTFITDKRGKKYFAGKNYKYHVLAIIGGGKKPIFLFKLVLSIFQSIFFLVKINPSLIIGFGGYPSFPPLYVGNLMKKKLAVHEQNSILGKVNRYFKDIAVVATSFSGMTGTCVGNPVRQEIMASPFSATKGKINILVIGGSQGAKIFSEVLPQVFVKFKDQINVTQQVVEADLEPTRRFYSDSAFTAEIAPFFGDMQKRLSENHLVICRSGSSTIFELAKVGRPAVFIPLGVAADNHQQINAEAVVTIGGAWMILEKDFNVDSVIKLLGELIKDPTKLEQAASNIRSFSVENSAAKLADLVLKETAN